MFAESDLLPISALQHLLYCERQCALIHLEQAWSENLHTARGRIAHKRVHGETSESRGRVRRESGLPLRSLALGVVGQADVVEFHKRGDGANAVWVPYPVEHKVGRAKEEDWDRVQLCAQALCLEEMCGLPVPEGALFYGKPRRREPVAFDAALRGRTAATAARLHALLAAGVTPPAVYASRKCRGCSLAGLCLPRTCSGKRPVARYMARIMEEEP